MDRRIYRVDGTLGVWMVCKERSWLYRPDSLPCPAEKGTEVSPGREIALPMLRTAGSVRVETDSSE